MFPATARSNDKNDSCIQRSGRTCRGSWEEPGVAAWCRATGRRPVRGQRHPEILTRRLVAGPGARSPTLDRLWVDTNSSPADFIEWLHGLDPLLNGNASPRTRSTRAADWCGCARFPDPKVTVRDNGTPMYDWV